MEITSKSKAANVETQKYANRAVFYCTELSAFSYLP